MASAGGIANSLSLSINNTEERTTMIPGDAAQNNSVAAEDLLKSLSRPPRFRNRPAQNTANTNANQHAGNVADESSRTAKTVHSSIILTLTFHLILLASLTTLVWLADVIFPSSLNTPRNFGLHFQVYVHVAMWAAFMICVAVLCRVHRTIRRTLTCLDLHNRTKQFKNFLLVYHSAFKVVVLLVVTLVADVCAKNKTAEEPANGFLQWLCRFSTSRVLLIQIITSVECAVAAVVTLLYLSRVAKHCRQDSYRMFVDSTGQFFETTSSLGGVPVNNGAQQQYLCNSEVGLQPDETQADIIEAQSDEIDALKRHNEALASKLLRTQEQIKQFNTMVT